MHQPDGMIMKKLPKIYQADQNKKINNNKKICYLEINEKKYKEEPNQKQEPELEEKNIEEVLEEIFSGIGYSYNIPITIKTHDKTYNTSLIAKTKKNLVTLDNEIIPIINKIDDYIYALKEIYNEFNKQYNMINIEWLNKKS